MNYSTRSLLLYICLFAVCPVFLHGQEAKVTDPEEKTVDTTLFNSLKLRSIGPAFMSGRIGDIAVDQQNPNTWYLSLIHI